MQSTAALGLLQSQSTRPCLDFSRLTLYPINLLADFKLSSFTIPHFKVSEHILARYAIPLEDGLSLTSTALKYTASCCVAQRDSYLSDAPWLYQTAADWMLED
ncbi:hypothetical protein F2P79_005503 [Pimephales promelas]|nr:hypothetical protein F2P79_005503 [Pimephales promelas]